MRFNVTLQGAVVVRDPDLTEDAALDAVEAHLGDVMDGLLELDALDAEIELNAEDGFRVTFTVCVEAANPLAAIETASGEIRTAIHAAHGATPDWPGVDDQAWAVQLLAVDAKRQEHVYA